jgi:putative hydrolase of HD superfamily
MVKKDIVEFIETIYTLKEIKRAGWVKRKIKNPESIADHTFGVMILTYLLAKENNLNETKCLKLALIHDLGESIIGDIITYNKKENFKKSKLDLEKDAIKKLSKLANKKEIEKLFIELSENKTKESKFIHQLDKLEAFIQSHKYSKNYDSDYLSFKNEIEKIATYKNIKNIIKTIDNQKE